MGCSRLFARLGVSLFLTSLTATFLLLGVTGPVWGQAGQLRVTGTVTSAVDASQLPAVRVSVKGANVSTLTATNGRYTIDAPSPTDTLVFNIIGYRASEVAIGGRSVVNVTMEAAAIAATAASAVAQMLQGRVAGVQVIPSSGKPGDTAVIRIRGIVTLNDASPLYVVDGMLLNDISFVNPSDIQSVDVMKDASAEAIYGSRGANGVIIITTRRGSLETGNRFTVRAYAGSQK